MKHGPAGLLFPGTPRAEPVGEKAAAIPIDEATVTEAQTRGVAEAAATVGRGTPIVAA